MVTITYADLVAETTTTTGTGDITLDGAVAGNRSFASVLVENNQFYYAIDGSPADPTQWEVGIGTFTSSGTVARSPIVSSSGTSAVDLAEGTKTITLTVAAEFFSTVQASLVTVQADITAVETDLATVATQVTTLQTDVGSVQTGLATVQSDVATLQTDVGTVATQVATLQTDVGSVQTGLATVQSDVATLQTDVGTVETQVATLQTDVGSVQTGLATVQSDVATLQTDVGAVETQVATLQTDVGSVQTGLATVQSDVATLQTDVGAVETQVATLQTDVGSVQTGLATVQSDVATLQTDVGAVETQVATLQTDVGSVQTGLATVQSDVATLQANDVFASWEDLPGNDGMTVTQFLDEVLNPQNLTTPMPAFSEINGSVRVALDFIPPSGLINSAGGDDAVPVKFINKIARFDSGPSGMETYYDTVAGFGTNVNEDFTRANTAANAGFGAASIRIESGFIQPGSGVSKAAEFHMGTYLLDDVERRHISVYAPADPAEYITGSIVGTCSALLNITDGNGRQRVLFDFRSTSNSVSMNGDGVSLGHPIFTFDTNNRAVARQRNAAGTSFLPLPFINANNNIEMANSPVYIVATTGTTPLGSGTLGSALAINVTSPTAGASAIRVAAAAVTGNFFPMSFNGGATGRFTTQIYNSSTGSGVLEIQSLNGSGNDGIIALSNVGVGGQSWTIGRDNSDGNKLKIEKSYLTVGSAANLFMEFDPTANVARFGMPAQLRSYTVAGLPSAATSGAGAMVFVSNESGGAVPAFSDGTDWRRMTDRAVVS